MRVSFEEEKVINSFLQKMVMYYPVGSDTSETVIKSFGIVSYPETFLIDKNGFIQWQGSLFELSEELLNRALGQDVNTQSLYVQDTEISSENSAYEFNLKKHELNMNKSSYFHYNPFDINVFNKDLPAILSTFFGYSKSRILLKDTALLSHTYDIRLTADKNISTEANCVEMFKYLLPEHLGLDIVSIEKDTTVNVLHVVNDTLLKSHLSEFDYPGSSKYKTKWCLNAATLTYLKNCLENEYLVLMET